MMNPRTGILIAIIAAAAAAGGAALLVNIMEKKHEALNPFYRVVELNDQTEDPEKWGKNFPMQYDGYKRTVDQVRTRYGGSEAVPRTPTQADPRSVVAQSRLEEDPRLKIMWAGYSFEENPPRQNKLNDLPIWTLTSKNAIWTLREYGPPKTCAEDGEIIRKALSAFIQ
jgi:formate-dependent nitrite reductase cytochrome c552 subunit